MLRFKYSIAIVAALMCASVFEDNSAYATEFEAVAAGCVPNGTHIQNTEYLVTGGTIKHRAGFMAEMVFRCPISQIITQPTRIYLMYADGSSINTNTRIDARLVKVTSASGGTGGLAYYCSVGSNGGTQNGAFQLRDIACSIPVADWSQNNAVWYIEVTVRRANTSDIATFYGAGVY